MKFFLFCLILAFSAPLLASSRDRQVLKCLGEEEKRLHLNKNTGPLYDLNQKLIGELIQIPRIELTDEANSAVCGSKNFSEALKMLELSLKFGGKIFVIPKDVVGMQRSITEEMIRDYVEISKELFLGFLAQVQQNAPTPSCLKEEIPELDSFLTEVKYLQEDLDTETLFKKKDVVIFLKLKNYPRAFERCRARLKKTLKSPSKAPAKKP